MIASGRFNFQTLLRSRGLGFASAWMLALALIVQSLVAVPHGASRPGLVSELAELSAAVGQSVVICEHDGDAARDGSSGPAREHGGCNDCCTLCSTSGGGMAPPAFVANIFLAPRALVVAEPAPSRDVDAPDVWAGLPNPARGPPSHS